MKALPKPLKQDQKTEKLEEVRQAFDHWRLTRKKFGPIPKKLWSAAVELTELYTLSQVSQSLRLNYTDLRKRVKRGVAGKLKKQSTSSINGKSENMSFVDLFNVAGHSSKESIAECSMEIHDRDGFSLKMHCHGEPGVDLLELCRIVTASR